MTPSGLRSAGDTPRPGPAGTGPGPATLAGSAGQEEGPDQGAAPEGGPSGGMSAQLGQALQQIQQTELKMTDMARQFPAASKSFEAVVAGLRQAGTALRAALRQVMTNPGQPEPPAPAIGG